MRPGWVLCALVVILLFVCLACDSPETTVEGDLGESQTTREVDLGETFVFEGFYTTVLIRGTGLTIQYEGFAHFDTFDDEIGPINCCVIVASKDGLSRQEFWLTDTEGPAHRRECGPTREHYGDFSIRVLSVEWSRCAFVVETSD